MRKSKHRVMFRRNKYGTSKYNINTVESQTECLHRLMQTGSITAREMAYGIKKLGERI